MSFSKLIAGTAAALLVIAPAVASAGTRAADSIPSVAKQGATPASKLTPTRAKSKVPSELHLSDGADIGVGVLAATAFVAAVVVVADSDS